MTQHILACTCLFPVWFHFFLNLALQSQMLSKYIYPYYIHGNPIKHSIQWIFSPFLIQKNYSHAVCVQKGMYTFFLIRNNSTKNCVIYCVLMLSQSCHWDHITFFVSWPQICQISICILHNSSKYKSDFFVSFILLQCSHICTLNTDLKYIRKPFTYICIADFLICIT